MADGDDKLKESVIMFNQFDLYTKADERPNLKKLKAYYAKLVDKYIPGKLFW